MRAEDEEAASVLLDAEEAEVRRILTAAAGDVVFGVDEEAIEDAVARVGHGRWVTLGLAESLTGGLASSRLVNVPGASRWFRGSVVSYASEVKFAVLGVPEGPVVSEEAARAMAEGARKVLESDVGLSITGVAGPDAQDGQPPGRCSWVWLGPGVPTESFGFNVPGDRDRVRQYATIAALDLLRRMLGAPPGEVLGHGLRERWWSAPRRGGDGRRGVTGMPLGTSSTQVLPGCKVIGRPVGRGEGGRLGEAGSAPGAGDGRIVPHDQQGPRPDGVHLHLEAALLVLDPGAVRRRHGHDHHVGRRGLGSVQQDVGRSGVVALVAGGRVPRPGHIRGRGEGDVDAGPRTGNRSRWAGPTE